MREHRWEVRDGLVELIVEGEVCKRGGEVGEGFVVLESKRQVSEAGGEVVGGDGLVEVSTKGETGEAAREGTNERSIEVVSQDELGDGGRKHREFRSLVHNLIIVNLCQYIYV